MRYFLYCLTSLLFAGSALAQPVPGSAPAVPGGASPTPDTIAVAKPTEKELKGAVSVGTGKHKLGYDGRAQSLYLQKDNVPAAPPSTTVGGVPATGSPYSPPMTGYQSNPYAAYPTPTNSSGSGSGTSQQAAPQAPALRSDSKLSGDKALIKKPAAATTNSATSTAAPANTAPPPALPLLPTGTTTQ